MSLARAVTKRIKRSEGSSSTPTRSQTMKVPKVPGYHVDRAKISSPVALLSTTNMLSYNAPDIATLRHASKPSSSSTHSADDSDHSASTARSRSSSQGSQDTLTDLSSVGSSPSSPVLKPNHLSAFFPAGAKPPRRSVSSSNLQQRKTEEVEPVPAIPERALSHSKRAHERLAQKRSLQHMPRTSMQSNRSSSSREQRSSVDMFQASIQEESHPFGKELEQLNEVAEEFGGAVRDAEYEADMAAIRERGLATFCAADYMQEIRPLFSSRFGTTHLAPPMAWI